MFQGIEAGLVLRSSTKASYVYALGDACFGGTRVNSNARGFSIQFCGSRASGWYGVQPLQSRKVSPALVQWTLSDPTQEASRVLFSESLVEYIFLHKDRNIRSLRQGTVLLDDHSGHITQYVQYQIISFGSRNVLYENHQVCSCNLIALSILSFEVPLQCNHNLAIRPN